MKTTVLFLGALLLAGPAWGEAERREALLGVATDFDGGKVTFEVASNGCTAKKDFRVSNEKGTLTVFRLRRDACKAMPERLKLSWTLQELGLSAHQPFTLGNQLIVNENVAQTQ